MKPQRLASAIAACMLLTSCATLPHRPTPGWYCAAEGPGARASADLAQDGSLLLAIWSWSTPGGNIVAYSGNGNARSFDTPTTGALRLPPVSGETQLRLSQSPGMEGWNAANAKGSKMGRPDEVTIDWDRLVAFASATEPLWLLRRYADGTISSEEVAKGDVLIGARALAEVRKRLDVLVADHAQRCVHSDDLYPEIILT